MEDPTETAPKKSLTKADPVVVETPAPAPADTAAQAAEAVVEEPTPLDGIFDAWIRQNVHNSPLSRETVAYAHLLQILPDLKRRILGGE